MILISKVISSIQRSTTAIALSSILLLCMLLLPFSCSDSVEKISVTSIDQGATSNVVIDGNVCYGCAGEYCRTLCPQKAVSTSQMGTRSVYIIDPEKCIRCGICIEKCPFGAITWKH